MNMKTIQLDISSDVFDKVMMLKYGDYSMILVKK